MEINNNLSHKPSKAFSDSPENPKQPSSPVVQVASLTIIPDDISSMWERVVFEDGLVMHNPTVQVHQFISREDSKALTEEEHRNLETIFQSVFNLGDMPGHMITDLLYPCPYTGYQPSDVFLNIAAQILAKDHTALLSNRIEFLKLIPNETIKVATARAMLLEGNRDNTPYYEYYQNEINTIAEGLQAPKPAPVAVQPVKSAAVPVVVPAPKPAKPVSIPAPAPKSASVTVQAPEPVAVQPVNTLTWDEEQNLEMIKYFLEYHTPYNEEMIIGFITPSPYSDYSFSHAFWNQAGPMLAKCIHLSEFHHIEACKKISDKTIKSATALELLKDCSTNLVYALDLIKLLDEAVQDDWIIKIVQNPNYSSTARITACSHIKEYSKKSSTVRGLLSDTKTFNLDLQVGLIKLLADPEKSQLIIDLILKICKTTNQEGQITLRDTNKSEESILKEVAKLLSNENKEILREKLKEGFHFYQKITYKGQLLSIHAPLSILRSILGVPDES